MLSAFFNDNWLWWSVPLATISLVLLLIVIFKLVDKTRRAELFSVPLAEATIIEFKDSGLVQLQLAGPRFTRAFAGLSFELVNASNNESVPVSRSVVRSRSSGISEMRMAYGVVIPEAGRYGLRVAGLRGESDYAGHRIIFAQPYTLYAVLCIIGIVFSGGGFIFGTVMSLIYLGNANG